MNAAPLLEVAGAIARETVDTEVQRAAAAGLLRLLPADRAGFLATTAADDGAAPSVAYDTAAPRLSEAGDQRLVACAREAFACRGSAVSGRVLCVTVADDEQIFGALFAERAESSDAFTSADGETTKELVPFVLASLANAALFASFDSLVAQEMTRVVEREASMQLVLDSMAEGLVVCDLHGVLGPIRSKAIASWFGEPAPETTLWGLLGDDAQGYWLQIGFEGIRDGFMPFELLADQMPSRVNRNGLTYQLTFQPVTEGDLVLQVVVTVRDVTLELAQARADRINREIPVIVGILMRDRSGFQAFVEDTANLFHRLTISFVEPDALTEQRRMVHTLKGNALTFGFTLFGDACHAFEDRCAEEAENMSAASVSMLEQEWTQSLERISMLLTKDDASVVQLSPDDYQTLMAHLEEQRDYGELIRMARGWTEPKVMAVLGPYLSTAKDVAERLGKELEVTAVDTGLRLPRSDLRGFCATLVHVVRNAIDHGIEAPEAREAAGKARAGRLEVGARIEGGKFIIRVQDDGRGIDWTRLRAKAISVGLPAETERDLVEALFADGVSTRDEVTAISGRGVGLGATRERCEALGGELTVKTVLGEGTVFEFAFPSAA